MARSITIQPGQASMGMDYDVHQPLPYPFHIDPDTGLCRRGRGTADLGEAPAGKPWQLLGFQACDMQCLVLTFADFVKRPTWAVGLRPVFSDRTGGVFALTVPITGVTEHEAVTS